LVAWVHFADIQTTTWQPQRSNFVLLRSLFSTALQAALVENTLVIPPLMLLMLLLWYQRVLSPLVWPL
jgi:hypothetical protein